MLKNICFLTVIACVYGVDNQSPLSDAANAEIINYIFNNDGLGNYKYGFSTSNGIERYEESVIENPESKDASPVVKGSYSYPGEDGKMIKIKYTADKNGFRPEGDSLYMSSYGKPSVKETQTKAPEINPRFHRQYVEEASNNYNTNPQTFDNYHTEVSHLLQQDDQQYAQEQFIPYTQNANYNNELQENNQGDQYNYDRSFLELLKANNRDLNNYNNNRPKPIIAILGDDGKLVDSSNFENLNIPESLLEILSRGNVPTDSKETTKVNEEIGVKPVIEASTDNIVDAKTESSSSSVTSETVDQAITEIPSSSKSAIESSKS